MKQLFTGRKKFITIPLLILLGLTSWQVALAAILLWFIYKQDRNKLATNAAIGLLILFALFLGQTWFSELTSSPKTQSRETSQNERNKTHATQSAELKKESVFSAQTESTNQEVTLAKVTAVIDGDTIEVELNGMINRVRYIGIDTPESVDPRKPIQCFSKEATVRNKSLVENKIVGLKKDISETDRYGRLLRYVYVGDLFINQALVEEGFAKASSYPPDITYQDTLRQAEQQARDAQKGLWGSCENATPTPTAKPATMGTTDTATQTTTNGTCQFSCTAPDRNCSDFSSHEQAQTFFTCCGFTVQNDPMNLDAVGTGDGIACENI
ncbi:MAG TPA: thermonuclease family protein [Patescibacteria group bacterium]|nr:thermonuclease family protein [Patescibacteria group bacterium]